MLEEDEFESKNFVFSVKHLEWLLERWILVFLGRPEILSSLQPNTCLLSG